MSSLISVVLPVYNAEEFLEEAIESILSQTYRNIEFIIINDGSCDKSLEIIEKYASKDERIIVISRENRGLVYSLNEGIKKAKGMFIARMDADDISLSQRFEKQVNLMEKNSLDICGCHYLSICSANEIQALGLVPLTQNMCFLSLASKVPFAHPSVMIRKSFLDDKNLLYGQSKYKTAEDFDLWLRMYEQNAVFGNVNDILFKYRVLDTSLSSSNNIAILSETKYMLNSFLDKYEKALENILNNSILLSLNTEEKSLLVRLIYKIYISKFHFFKAYKSLKGMDKKIVLCTILSELKNR